MKYILTTNVIKFSNQFLLHLRALLYIFGFKNGHKSLQLTSLVLKMVIVINFYSFLYNMETSVMRTLDRLWCPF